MNERKTTKNDLSLIKKLFAAGKKSEKGSIPCDRFADRRYPSSLFFKTGGIPLETLKKDRGGYGEYLLYDRLRKARGKWLFNLYLPHRGGSTEIDAMLISPRGVFLFESKNFSGRVYGLPGQREWVHTFRAGKSVKKQRFFNPLMQNKAHETAARALLDGNVPVFPVVVFGKNCTLEGTGAGEYRGTVTTLGAVKKAIAAHKETRLSSEEIERIHALFLPYTKVGEAERKEHIASVGAKNAHK